MNVDVSTALVPYHGIVHPLVAIENRGMATYYGQGQPRAGIRFLGYGNPGGGNVYGSRGRMVNEQQPGGNRVDIYV